MEIRRMRPEEIGRIGEIDRSERVLQHYVLREGHSELREEVWNVPRWPVEDDGTPHCVPARVRAMKPWLDRGGTMIGAFDKIGDEERLVGFIIYYPDLAEDMAQMAALHITRDYRGKGLGSTLIEKVFYLARRDGKRWMYVTATPSCPTVDFYMGKGFRPTMEPIPELYEEEPDDIHMVKEF